MIGITERGDASIDNSWLTAVNNNMPCILITKDPYKLSSMINKDMNIIVHATITGYGSTILEPNVPQPSNAVKGLLKIISMIGIERTVLRVDPIIPYKIKGCNKIPFASDIPSDIINNIRKRISFMDNYPHVKQRMIDVGLEPLPYDFHAPLSKRIEIWEKLKRPEVCGEPSMECTGCISQKDVEILNTNIQSNNTSKQRQSCKCLSIKTELLTNKKQCGHKCLYCYWR